MAAVSLLAAAAGNDLSSVQRMLENDQCSDINETNAAGMTALCYAAANGNCEMVAALMRKRKCDYHKCDEDKNTALHLACSKGHGEVVRVMVSHMKHEHDLDLELKNEQGQTAYDVAQLHGHTACCELLGGELKKRHFMCYL